MSKLHAYDWKDLRTMIGMLNMDKIVIDIGLGSLTFG